MVLNPRSASTVYDDLKAKLTSKVAGLTNFAPGGFNDNWIDAYSQQVHEAEVKSQAAELSGWVDWAGNTNLTQDDLDRLGITGAEPSELNEYMDSEHLDELAKIVGVSRDPGARSSGKVTFTVSTDSVTIPEGFEVGTEPDNDGNFRSFYVDADGDGEIDETSSATISPGASQTTVEGDIIAGDVGDEYNVGTNAITFIPNIKPGIESVVNDSETTGGTDEQKDKEYRKEIKNAVFSTSEGGTKLGIEGYIEDNATSDVDVDIKEFTDNSPPYVDVIVDGGSDDEITALIDESRPVGIRHDLVRPSSMNFGVRTELVGTDIDTTFVSEQIQDYLTDLGVGNAFSRSQLTLRIMQADNAIETMASLSVTMTTVSNELHTFVAGTNTYELNEGPIGTVTDESHRYRTGVTDYELLFDDVTAGSVRVEAMLKDERTELTQGSTEDYTVEDVDGDGLLDTVRLTENTTPDEGSTLLISYNHASGSVTNIVDESGTTYIKGTDYTVVDTDADGLLDTIDWSIGGSSPADQARFFVDYAVKRSIVSDLGITEYEKVSPDTNTISVVTYEN